MGAWFSKSKSTNSNKSRVTEQDKAVLGLKQSRDKLKQYEKRICLQLEKERLVAKRLLAGGNKEKALTLLKKKRYQEQMLSKLETQLSNLERMANDIEFAQLEIKVVEGLKEGNTALKQLHQIMSIEDVEKIMDDTKEGVDYQRDIDELLAGQLTEDDNEAIMDELRQLTQPEVTDITVNLPDVPTHDLPVGEKPLGADTAKVKHKEMVSA